MSEGEIDSATDGADPRADLARLVVDREVTPPAAAATAPATVVPVATVAPVWDTTPVIAAEEVTVPVAEVMPSDVKAAVGVDDLADTTATGPSPHTPVYAYEAPAVAPAAALPAGPEAVTPPAAEKPPQLTLHGAPDHFRDGRPAWDLRGDETEAELFEAYGYGTGSSS